MCCYAHSPDTFHSGRPFPWALVRATKRVQLTPIWLHFRLRTMLDPFWSVPVYSHTVACPPAPVYFRAVQDLPYRPMVVCRTCIVCASITVRLFALLGHRFWGFSPGMPVSRAESVQKLCWMSISWYRNWINQKMIEFKTSNSISKLKLSKKYNSKWIKYREN